MNSQPEQKVPTNNGFQPFRRAIFRGLGMILPPLLTVVIIIWIGNTVQDYVLVPVESSARYFVAMAIEDIHPSIPGVAPEDETAQFEGTLYRKTPNGQWVPENVYDTVESNLTDQLMPRSGSTIYREYVQIRYLQRRYTIPALLSIFILILYFSGKFVAAGVGRILWTTTEKQVLQRLPLIRNVYSSVKQVTDFLLNEQEIEFTRVVAVEYPRKGIWTVGFVTSESMLDIHSAANEPMISVLIPTSPMPATGFTVNVKKSETIDLDISLDQALQFIVSCGVVVPEHQRIAMMKDGTQLGNSSESSSTDSQGVESSQEIAH
ncbi:MAG: DUF502 domain-containing protein [Pirellulales bacterium]